MSFLGLTWDHPRGYNALAEAERLGGPIHWEVQPLEGFESAPIGELCAKYDLVVLDHPHLGEAMAEDCLQPLNNILPAEALQQIASGAVGPAYDSYSMQGHQWALPLDAASQVMAVRPDLITKVPSTWAEVIALSNSGKVGLSLAGPHACLSLLSMASGITPDLDMRDGGWPNQSTLVEAYEILQELAGRSPKSILENNPIGILDHMTRDDDVALVPLIYGYVNYSDAGLKKPLRFHDAPRAAAGIPGSIIGGTGIAISKKCTVTDALVDHLLWLLSPEAQTAFLPSHDGQPGLSCAWQDGTVNAASGDFYAYTLQTLTHSTVRPRHNGYIALQSEISAYLRDALQSSKNAAQVAETITAMFESSLPKEDLK